MIEAKDIQRGNYFIYNNEIFHVIRKEKVTFGTHSHSKTKLFIRNLLGGGEKAINFAHHDQLENIDIIRKIGQVISKANDKVQVMDMKSYETLNAEIKPELFNDIKEGDNIIFIEHKGIVRVLERAR